MKYELILEKGKYALIKRGNSMTEYAVVYGLNKENGNWCNTVSYCGFGGLWHTDEAIALQRMLEVFLIRTKENYIHRNRLIEIATMEKDMLMELDEDETMEFFESELQLEDYEREFFGVDDETEIPEIEEEL